MVVIVIVNWNGGSALLDCIRSIDCCGVSKIKIVVIDNASADDSVERIQREFSEVHVIASQENSGFSGGCNKGIRYADQHFDYNFIWLLNPDTIVQTNALSAMTSFAAHNHNVGLVGSNIIYPDGNVQALGGGYKIPFIGHTRHKVKASGDLGYITGASMLIRREVINSIGLLDENIFLYWDDVDYSWRAKKHGYKIDWCKDSVVVHAESSSTNSKPYLKDYYYHHAHAYVLLKHKKYLSLLLAVILKIATKLRPSGIKLLKYRLSGWVAGSRTFFSGKAIKVLYK